MKKGWSKVCLAAALIIFVLQLAQASLTVTGAFCLAEVYPDQVFRYVIDATINESSDPQNYSIEILGIGQDVNGSIIAILPDRDLYPYTARPFLYAYPQSFHLDTGEHEKVTIEIMVPDDIGEGTRYALVGIHSNPVGGPLVGISIAVNVPVMFYKKGSAFLKNGEITSVNWSRQSDQLNILLLFKNTGNTHYKAFARADLRDMAGNLIAENSTSLSFASLLPTSSHIFDIRLNPGRTLAPGIYSLNSSVLSENGTVLDAMQTSVEINGA
jgi:hypothetical protein